MEAYAPFALSLSAFYLPYPQGRGTPGEEFLDSFLLSDFREDLTGPGAFQSPRRVENDFEMLYTPPHDFDF